MFLEYVILYKNMLYTKKGDGGTTKLFNCPQGVRLGKTDPIFEALGALDELNSFLGYLKVLIQKEKELDFCIDFEKGNNKKIKIADILERIQQNLFCIQAEVGGAEKNIKKEEVNFLEEVIAKIEEALPPINSFIVSGGSESGALFDFVRAISRRAERRVIQIKDRKEVKINSEIFVYLNRLSSVFYALARFVNLEKGIKEIKPNY